MQLPRLSVEGTWDSWYVSAGMWGDVQVGAGWKCSEVSEGPCWVQLDNGLRWAGRGCKDLSLLYMGQQLMG